MPLTEAAANEVRAIWRILAEEIAHGDGRPMFAATALVTMAVRLCEDDPGRRIALARFFVEKAHELDADVLIHERPFQA